MLKEDIQKAIYKALKEKKETELKALRFVMSQIKYKEIDKKDDLTDEEVVSVLSKEIKKRKEAIEMFKKGKRTDLVKDEEKQIKVIERYMPKQLSRKDLKIIIEEVISSTSEPHVGKIIGQVMAKTKGRAEGKTVSKLVNEITSKD